ncbi:phosphoglycerate transporter protein PgtP [Klebsiella pneumoniae]|nr:phosphoglycerate transporter protein PgtP [Klebsiella pneumoniae]
MLSLLKKGPSANKVPAEKIQATYGRYRMQALLSVFLGYLAYYIVRNNFTLSTPYLKEQLDLSATQIGLLSSCMLIAYGISKGVMSSLADKASPKVFMACGLVLCAIVNVGLGFSTAFWVFAALVVLNGLFQGMGVGPSFITIANWFPRRERGRVGAFWNISHNVGGGIVAPIVGAAFAILGTEHWQSASYIVPACVAVVFAISVLVLGKGSPREEGLPSLAEMMPEEKVVLKTKHGQKAPENMSAFQIFCTYVLRNKNAWYVSFVDVFVYMVRFGMISWLPIYLLTVKHFSKEQMSVAFLFFEWAAIPSTLLAGWLSDKLFKGRDAVSYNLYDANLHLSDWLLEKRISADGHGIRGDCGLPYLCPAVSGLGPNHGNRPQLCRRFSRGSARIYELYLWRIVRHQPVRRNGR